MLKIIIWLVSVDPTTFLKGIGTTEPIPKPVTKKIVLFSCPISGVAVTSGSESVRVGWVVRYVP